jgi:hypothetical protein
MYMDTSIYVLSLVRVFSFQTWEQKFSTNYPTNGPSNLQTGYLRRCGGHVVRCLKESANRFNRARPQHLTIPEFPSYFWHAPNKLRTVSMSRVTETPITFWKKKIYKCCHVLGYSAAWSVCEATLQAVFFLGWLSTLKMEPISSSQTSDHIRRYIPEDGNILNYRCENLKSYTDYAWPGCLVKHTLCSQMPPSVL